MSRRKPDSITLEDFRIRGAGMIAMYPDHERKSRRIIFGDHEEYEREGGTCYRVLALNSDGTKDEIYLPKETEIKMENPKQNRQYLSSPLTTLAEHAVPPERETMLLALYGEICESWRLLTDVRFKLLGLVPTVSAVVLTSLLSKDDPAKGLSQASRIVIACFGLIVTLGIYLYDQRNTELYDDLVSRARMIEEELGIDTGQFRGRKASRPFRIFGRDMNILGHTVKFVQHDVATNTIYWTAILAWLIAILLIRIGGV